MSKIKSYDFARYVALQHMRVRQILASKFQAYGEGSLAGDIEQLSNLQAAQSTPYWPADDYDIRPLMNSQDYNDCLFSIGWTKYDIGMSYSDGATYQQEVVPPGAVAVYSDGVVVDNRSGTSSIYRTTPWDRTKDITVQGKNYKLRYCICYCYSYITSMEDPGYVKTIVFNKVGYTSPLSSFTIGEKGNSLGLIAENIYLKDSHIDTLTFSRYFASGSYIFNDVILDNSSLEHFSLNAPNYWVQRLKDKNIDYGFAPAGSSIVIAADYVTYRNPTFTGNAVGKTGIFELTGSISNLSTMPSFRELIVVPLADFRLSNQNGLAQVARHLTFDCTQATAFSIGSFTVYASATSGPRVPVTFDIITPSGYIDFNIDLRVTTSASSTYSYMSLSYTCLEKIFDKLANLTGQASKTIKIGAYAKTVLATKVAEAEAKGWVVE